MKSKVMHLKSGVAGVSLVAFGLMSPELLANTGGVGDIGKNLAAQAGGISQAIFWFSLVAGLALVAYSLFAGFAASKPNSQTGWKPVIMAFLFGSALLSISAITSVGSSTLGVDQTRNVDQVLQGFNR